MRPLFLWPLVRGVADAPHLCRFKEQCVAYKGGKCERCGYDKYIGSLEFHHKDPTEKDFSVAHARLTSFSERVKRELDKCELLCSNCHREVHALLKGLI